MFQPDISGISFSFEHPSNKQLKLFNTTLKYVEENFVDDFPLMFFNEVVKEINRIKRNGYITKVDYDKYLNYINKPIYLEKIDGIPIIRNKSIVNLVLGIIDALSSFEEFFENLYSKTDNPKEELKKWAERYLEK